LIKIVLETGETFVGETYLQIVQQLKNVFPRDETKREYMENVSVRARIWDASRISTSSPRAFIHDLKRIGIVKTIDEFDKFDEFDEE